MKSLIETIIVESVIKDVKKDMSNEEIIHLILENKVADNVADDKYTFGQKAADKLASFAGSWTFIIGFGIILAIWVIANVIMLTGAFDPYPFILLNLVLSCLASIQAPLIMMSQNRQEEKDRQRAQNDYKVNLKTEIIIQDIHNKLDQLITNQEILKKEIDQANKEKTSR